MIIEQEKKPSLFFMHDVFMRDCHCEISLLRISVINDEKIFFPHKEKPLEAPQSTLFLKDIAEAMYLKAG
jgi:hypothetical protein